MEHDYCYGSNIPKSECDKSMLGKLSSSESKTFGEKVAKHLIVKAINGIKYQLIWVKNIMWKYFTANNTRFYLDA